MDSKPNTVIKALNGRNCTLPGYSVLAVEGTDALAFLQAQLMNDLDRLGDGDWQWNGWLNPKGRVIALMIALRVRADCLWLLLRDMPSDEMATQLQRYVFRSKLTLTPRPDLRVIGRILPPAGSAHADDPGLDTAVDHEYVLDIGHDVMPADAFAVIDEASVAALARRQIVLTAAGADSTAGSGTSGSGLSSDGTLGEWQLSDLRGGLPRLQPAQREQFTPQMLALGRLQAYSVKKGCYPGQEVVSRTHYLGQAKRQLQRLLLPPGLRLSHDTPICSEGREAGRLVDWIDLADHSEVLAVLPVDGSDFQIDGTPLQSVSLLPLLLRGTQSLK